MSPTARLSAAQRVLQDAGCEILFRAGRMRVRWANALLSGPKYSTVQSPIEPLIWRGVGTSKYTRDKLECVNGWLDILTRMSRGILRKYDSMPRQYTVIDMNAGPGRYFLHERDPSPVDGTPLVVMRRLARSGLTWRAAFVESHAQMSIHLRYWLDSEAANLRIDPSNFDVLEGDHSKVLLPWVREAVPRTGGTGLLIHDPNGAPNLTLLEQLVAEPQLARFDVAIYVQATSLKRVLNLPQKAFNTEGWRPLHEALARVKSHWVVRAPRGSNQYALCVGTNGALGADWAKMQFGLLIPSGAATFSRRSPTRKRSEGPCFSRSFSTLAERSRRRTRMASGPKDVRQVLDHAAWDTAHPIA